MTSERLKVWSCALLLGSQVALAAMAAPREAEVWTLLLPREHLRERDGASGRVFEAKVRAAAAGRIVVDGVDQEEVGFPALMQVRLLRERYKRGRNTTSMRFVVELGAASGGQLFLDFVGFDPAEARLALEAIAAPAPVHEVANSPHLEGSYATLAGRAFPPELMVLPLGRRVGLLRAIHEVGASPRIEHAMLRSEHYLALEADSVSGAGMLELDSGQRVLRVFNSRFLTMIDGLADELARTEQLTGVRLAAEIVSNTSPIARLFGGGEWVEAYVPTAALVAPVAGDQLTASLIDQCSFFIDGQPITPGPQR